MNRLRLTILFVLAFLVLPAHVGSPDAWFRGNAGPYKVLVHIQAPSVIPGIATVNTWVEGDAVQAVHATADRFDATGGAPPPEPGKADEDVPGLYRTKLWIMTSGSFRITVTVEGKGGSGSVVVPLAAAPLRRLPFAPLLGLVLGAAGIVLFAGLVNIVGAGVRQGVLPPGEEPDGDRITRSSRAMLYAVAGMALVLLGGWRWWVMEDRTFEALRYRPMASVAEVRDSMLAISITDSAWIAHVRDGVRRRARPGMNPTLVEDHGKIMHVFVVDADNGRTFAHLHPGTLDTVTFTGAIPPLPPGRYHVFADMVHNSGFTHTLATTLQMPAGAGATAFGDADDSFVVGVPAPGILSSLLGDGSAMSWVRTDTSVVAGVEAGLRFKITAPVGTPPLEPYMGMPAHAAIVKEGGGVFVHLHSFGTISMAAQARLSGDSVRTEHAQTADILEFPYAFPEPGRYFIWVQAKRAGQVLTGVFETQISAPRR